MLKFPSCFFWLFFNEMFGLLRSFTFLRCSSFRMFALSRVFDGLKMFQSASVGLCCQN